MKKGRLRNRPITESEAYREMVARGKEITAMIRIFNLVRELLPAGPAAEFEKVAKSYAERNDKGRGNYSPGKIDFDPGFHGINSAHAEKFNDKVYKSRL